METKVKAYSRKEMIAECARIRDMYKKNPEGAHLAEDDLLEAFIRQIAAGLGCQYVARELVKGLLDVERERWYS